LPEDIQVIYPPIPQKQSSGNKRNERIPEQQMGDRLIANLINEKYKLGGFLIRLRKVEKNVVE
jgi:hypothetical protein